MCCFHYIHFSVATVCILTAFSYKEHKPLRNHDEIQHILICEMLLSSSILGFNDGIHGWISRDPGRQKENQVKLLLEMSPVKAVYISGLTTRQSSCTPKQR